MRFPRVDLQKAVKGDRRTQLEAIRDYIAHQLEGELCKTCLMSRLRTGDQAALILRLQQVLAELGALPGEGTVSDLDEIRLRLASRPGKTSASTDVPLTGKSAPRRNGTNRPGGGRRPAGAV